MTSKQHADWRHIGRLSLTPSVRWALILCIGPLSWAPAVQAANKTWTNPVTGSWTAAANWIGGVPTATDSATFNKAGAYTVNFTSVFQDLNDMFFSVGTVTFERLANPATLTVLNASGGRDLTIGGATLNMGELLPVNITVGDDTIINSGGTINVRAGSFLNTQDLFVNLGGALSLANGTITPSGTTRIDGGATISQGAFTTTGIGDFFVGYGGTGTLAITSGASIRSGNGVLGALANSTGVTTITGAGSRWVSDGFIDVGVDGSGIMQIENVGEAAAFAIRLGINPQSTGSVTVNGAGTEFRQQTIVVGQSGSATLRVEAGALVDTRFDASIAELAGSVGDAVVTGLNSVWSLSGVLAVGGDGTGTLTLTDGGTVIVYRPPAAVPPPSELRINAISTVHIGAGGLAGTLQTDLLIDNGTLNFDHTDAITQSAAISGAGQIVKNGAGSTTLTNASAFSGRLVASGGQLILQGSLTASLYAATPGGTLRFDGSTVSMSGVSAIRASGGTVEYIAATVNGGILRGDLPGTGTHTIVSSGFADTFFNGVTIQNSVNLIQNGYAVFNNVTNGGRLTSNQFLFFDGGVNATSGHVIVNQLISTRDFTNNGQITVNAGGELRHMLGNLASGGGSRTTVNAGGVITLLGGAELDLNGALLVNNGTINGTTNVNYGSLAKGTGTYGVVNVNTGGVYAPGNSPGISTAAAVNFDNTPVTSGAPTLAIELGGTTLGDEYDQLLVTGHLSLGGTLAVSLINSFAPVVGQSFDILDWGSLSGTFSSLSLPTFSGALAWNTSQLYVSGVLSISAAGLPGDYNNNGVVDAADYVVWRKLEGTSTALPNDPNGVPIDSDQYSTWRANFGGTQSGSGGSPIPEPVAGTYFVLAALMSFVAVRRRGR